MVRDTYPALRCRSADSPAAGGSRAEGQADFTATAPAQRSVSRRGFRALTKPLKGKVRRDALYDTSASTSETKECGRERNK